ncbi:MAG: hypothetical protein ACT4PO_01520, partial [Actinomycetota bacterium]
VWSGRLPQDPYVSAGIAEVQASGYLDRLSRQTVRLLYQSRDVGLWTDAKEAPYELGGADVIEVSTKFSTLNGNIIAAGNGSHALAFWAPGTPRGLTRLAFDIASGIPTGTQIQISRFTGPSGARTVVATLAAGAASAQDIDLGTAKEDALMVDYQTSTNFAGPFPAMLRIANMRVNGIIPATGTPGGDVWRVSDTVKDVGHRVGYDITEVAASRLNPLPLDWTGTFENLLTYCEALQGDHHWFVAGESSTGPRLSFTQWQDIWEVSLAREAIAQLPPIPISNRVVVNYTDVATTAPRLVTVDAVPNPLGPGEVSVYYLDMPDQQKDSALATLVAANLVEQVSVPRRTGTVDTASAKLQGNPTASVYQIRPGAIMRITDWGSGISLDVPVAEVDLSSRGVRLGIERPVSVATILARAALNQIGVGTFFTFGRNATLPPAEPGKVPAGAAFAGIGRDNSGRGGGGGGGGGGGTAPGSGPTLVGPIQPLSIS